MHVLSRTDVIASASGELQERAVVFEEAALLCDTFCNDLATEGEHFSSGATFRCAPEQTRWQPCRDYAEDEFDFNPFRLAPIG